MNVPEEDNLIHCARDGDSQAFEKLVIAYYPIILNFCYRLLGNRADAEDVTQEVFIQAAEKISLLRRTDAFRPWLYTIARSRSKDAQRRRIRQERREDSYSQSLQLVEEAELEKPALWDHVAALPMKLKDAVVLVYWEELNHSAAAKILKCAESTISWRIHEAKKQLKELMEASNEQG